MNQSHHRCTIPVVYVQGDKKANKDDYEPSKSYKSFVPSISRTLICLNSAISRVSKPRSRI
jgi:hypothetical protein